MYSGKAKITRINIYDVYLNLINVETNEPIGSIIILRVQNIEWVLNLYSKSLKIHKWEKRFVKLFGFIVKK